MRANAPTCSRPDRRAGMLFVALGTLGLVLTGVHALVPGGPTAAMFPRAISGLLLITGLISLVAGRRSESTAAVAISIRALIGVVCSVLIFSLLIESAGLLAASLAATIAVALTFGRVNWRELVVFSLAVALVIALLFVELLNQPAKLLPGF
jgi:hypothetical protein